MNRQQANAELARRLGLNISENGQHRWRLLEDGSIDNMAMCQDSHNGPICERCYYSYCMHCDRPRDNCTPTPPDYFQDEAAAWKMVKWFKLKSWPAFYEAMRSILIDKTGQPVGIVDFMLAEPAEIAKAACVALEIELEEETK